ncbi:Non-specific lipid-transfer protein 4 [Linum grandiflorum]
MASRNIIVKAAAAPCSLLLICSIMVITMAPNYYVKAQQMSCSQINTLLIPCIPYSMQRTEAPTTACCQGVNTLSLVKTTEEARANCQCVKDGTALVPGVNYDRVNDTPTKCGTKQLYVVTPNTDCSKVTLQN